MFEFFRCLAASVVETGIRGLADLVPGGDAILMIAGAALEEVSGEASSKTRFCEDILQTCRGQLRGCP